MRMNQTVVSSMVVSVGERSVGEGERAVGVTGR